MDDEVALVYTAKADKRERRSTTPKFYFGLAGGAGQPADFNASSSKCKCVVQVFFVAAVQCIACWACLSCIFLLDCHNMMFIFHAFNTSPFGHVLFFTSMLQ